MNHPTLFQEYDCPNQQCDKDFNDDEIVIVGQRFYCSWCGQDHTPEEVGLNETAIMLADGELHWRGLPKDAAEKAAWIEESRRAVQIKGATP